MISRKFAVVLFVITSLVASGVGFLTISNSSDTVETSVTKRVQIAVNCIESAAEGLIATANPVETCLAAAAEQLTSLEEISKLLDGLTIRGRTNEKLRSNCNKLYREIGVTAWKIGGLDAFTEGHSACGFGFYYGAMSEAIAADSDGKNFTALTKFCESFSVDSSSPSLGEWYPCMEGIGEALAKIGNNNADLEEMCAKVSTTDTLAVGTCFSGALKEQLSTRNTSKQKPAEAITACDYSNKILQAVCYKYVLNYSGSTADEITKLCISLLDGPTKRGCWAGVGMLTGSTELFASPESPGYNIETKPAETAKVITSVCGLNKTDHCETSLLIELSLRVLDYNSVLPICSLLADNSKVELCRSIVEQQQPVLLPAK